MQKSAVDGSQGIKVGGKGERVMGRGEGVRVKVGGMSVYVGEGINMAGLVVGRETGV